MDIKVTVRGTYPHIPFEEMTRAVLGSSYHLSIVVCGDSLAQRINREYRKKTYRPNVLSFPLSRTEGEIFLNLRKAQREASAMGLPLRRRFALLFVHALFHLKGLAHGERMERAEARVLRRFSLD